MVLINGVKYACERCIRGHRVTTCTHTDQPLTMIKPKGRPATQCQHCREQRKNKNLHTVCTCGKKGKSPGMHLALCQCHKNSHCTCSSNASKKSDTKKKLQKSMSELSIRKDKDAVGDSGVAYEPPSGSGMDAERPFEMGNGLFDMFSPSSDSFSATLVPGTSSGVNNGANSHVPKFITKSRSVELQSSAFPGDSSMHTKTTTNTNTNTDAAIKENANKVSPRSDLADNMFPLFPLVGNSSFSTCKDQPMSPIPDHIRAKLDPSLNLSGPLVNDNDNGNNGISHYQPIRPKRPESSLSITSNSSSGSRPNVNMENLNYLNIQPTSAYPPNGFEFPGDSNDITSNSLFDDEYGLFIKSLSQEEKREIPQTNPQLDKKSSQYQLTMDLELHPMFTELMLPMNYNNSKTDK